MDHTRQYAHGGPTTEHNLAAACAHDHDLRDNGWQVIQTSPGHLTWISRTGHRYPAEPPPIIEPMPEPFAPNGWTPASTACGLASSGYGAGSIAAAAREELPFLPTWNHEPAWWEEPRPRTRSRATGCGAIRPIARPRRGGHSTLLSRWNTERSR
ncbi:HNH endonuclease [Microtetraspora sp. AC03309]|nr:HNH endonuclease [Microtetraspora sp. AC03309]